MVDIDWLVVEYDQAVPVALVEYKNEHARPVDPTHPSYRALALLKGERLDFQAKVREHSRKPAEFYDLVRCVSPEPRKDMFSREPHDGFEQWGNEPSLFAEATA